MAKRQSKQSGAAAKPATKPAGGGRGPKSEHPKERYDKPPFPKQDQRSPGIEAELKPLPQWKGAAYRPAGKLEGRVALITGGDSGIGRAVAYFFAREGADVVIACLAEEKQDAKLVQSEIRKLGRECEIVYGDLAELQTCVECVERTMDAFGRLDVLVHNAAWQNRKDSVAELSEEELDRTMKVNVYAYARLVRAAVPKMKPGSCIIATGSVVGLEGSARLPDYSATKGAIHTLTKTFASELMDKGIRVNCVAPGPVWTPLNVADEGFDAEEVSEFGRETGESDMERPAQPEELAPAYVFLASNADSSYITGIVLPVTGGPA